MYLYVFSTTWLPFCPSVYLSVQLLRVTSLLNLFNKFSSSLHLLPALVFTCPPHVLHLHAVVPSRQPLPDTASLTAVSTMSCVKNDHAWRDSGRSPVLISWTSIGLYHFTFFQYEGRCNSKFSVIWGTCLEIMYTYWFFVTYWILKEGKEDMMLNPASFLFNNKSTIRGWRQRWVYF